MLLVVLGPADLLLLNIRHSAYCARARDEASIGTCRLSYLRHLAVLCIKFPVIQRFFHHPCLT